ncbi:MAG: hypothetical protein GX410_02955 [Elusimicrobia bacterium]|nr:hypothetical protein [Elusimicrobiota bacterium]
MENDGRHSLYLRGEDLPSPGVMADVFSAVYPLSHEEAFHKARHCWGILAENIGSDEAEKLEQACRRSALETLRLPPGCVPVQPQAQTSRKISFDEASFSCELEGGEQFSSGWDALEIAAAAPVKEETVKKETIEQGPSLAQRTASLVTMTVTGLPIAFGGKKESVERETVIREMNYIMDLGFGQRRIRLRSDHMDYACLGAEKSYSSQTNFRVMAAKLDALAGGAFRNRGLKLIAARQPLQALSYDGLDDFERDYRRLFILRSAAGGV